MVYYWLMDDLGYFVIKAKLRAWALMLASDTAEAAPLVRGELASLKLSAKPPQDIADEIDRLRALIAPTSIVSGVN